MMPVTSLTNLPPPIARTIEIGPLDYQRKLGQAAAPQRGTPARPAPPTPERCSPTLLLSA